MSKVKPLWMAGVLMGSIFPIQQTLAQTWSYPGCANITDADFTYEMLVQSKKSPDPTLAEPVKMAFDMDADGNTDIYFTEVRPGNIKKYDAKTKLVKTLVKLPNWGLGSDYYTVKNANRVEEGVTGIALDPKFKLNGWIYIHWSPLPAEVPTFRISRFTVKNESIDLNSEKILMQYEAQRDECCHTGGAMAFDDYGDLWIAQGANGGRTGSINTIPQIGMSEVKKYESEEWGSTSTHGYRGSILRIHPDDSQKGYSIPSGNFGEYFAKQTGKAEYLDTSKVYPEIFIKGVRNPYSLVLDPVRRWVLFADVGPDDIAVNLREELNCRKTPGFEGWPYFVGNNSKHSGTKDALAPTNTSKWNTGLTTLPPARPATRLHDIGTSPTTGPLYRYDGDSKSKVKLPPHFNRKWFVTDFISGKVQVLTLDSLGEKVIDAQPIFTNGNFSGPVDFQAGPDGAFYLVNYGNSYFNTTANTSIVKISYLGLCRDSTLKLEKPQPLGIRSRSLSPSPSGWLINLGDHGFILTPEGAKELEIFNISGKKVWDSGPLKGGKAFQLPDRLLERLPAGALKYRWLLNTL